jgi:hypothetical protein
MLCGSRSLCLNGIEGLGKNHLDSKSCVPMRASAPTQNHTLEPVTLQSRCHHGLLCFVLN